MEWRRTIRTEGVALTTLILVGHEWLECFSTRCSGSMANGLQVGVASRNGNPGIALTHKKASPQHTGAGTQQGCTWDGVGRVRPINSDTGLPQLWLGIELRIES